jgi:dTDP-4-dehydrorhamnose 3,5-epimerase
METYHHKRYAEMGIRSPFVQDNLSHSRQNVLRGLHYQLQHAQAKLVFVLSGEIFDVAVDLRRGSPAFGKWFGATLSCENKRQIYIPEGLAHGFCVVSPTADVIYKCTDFYAPGDEYGLRWNDPDLGIEWPTNEAVLSMKDSRNPLLRDIPSERLPVYKECSAGLRDQPPNPLIVR